MNSKKDIGSLYANKDDCREFESEHGEVSVMSVAEIHCVKSVRVWDYSSMYLPRVSPYSVQMRGKYGPE